MAESRSEAAVCPNCGAELPAPAAFCPACGQRQGPLFPSVLRWLRDALDELFAVDAKLPESLRKLIWPPGELTVEWFRGRRARYIRPFRLYLASALLFFLALPSTPVVTVLEAFIEGFSEGSGRPVEDESVRVAAQVVTESLPGLLIILLVPAFAALLFLVNRGRGGYVGNLVTALHVHTLGFGVVAATSVPSLLLGGHGNWEDVVMFPLAGGFIAWMAAALARVYDVGPIRALARALVAGALYLVLVTEVIVVVLGVVVA